ncbi:MAG: 2-amino-4-hydroxy-6-hydroxymethyldihydropteridine diphosphokinase [Rhodospirillaceae bacterium]|nr:2-amino-4-hydroxy-6-hydroxymethyldihydropteridine diphosphokinase [Rhodospirillaceae bacterium]|tara:strand:+ start:1969 stop:2472 length:504 start_codon:yes stop_codon:yes gene_type:complete
MIFIGLGANLPHPLYGKPQATIKAAVAALTSSVTKVLACSPLYISSPVPISDDPLFINAVALMDTDLAPSDLMSFMHSVEELFGRIRTTTNAARVLDLDLIAYKDFVSVPDEIPILPHPRMSERGFVLLPLADLVPTWKHCKTGISVRELIAALPPEQNCVRLPDDF